LTESKRGPAAGKPGPEDGGDERRISREFGRRLLWAYGIVAIALGAFAGAYTLASPFAKTGGGLLVLAVVGIAVLVVAIAAIVPLANKLREKVGGPAVRMVAVGVVALGIGVGIGRIGGGTPGQPHAKPPVTPLATESGSTPAQTPTSASASASASSCPKQLTITSPKNGASIIGQTGVMIDIEACDLTAGETGWVFDYDGTYGLDGSGAVVTTDGLTPFEDSPVGEAGDVDESVKLTVVLADAACTSALNAMDIANTYPSSLPPSCIIEDQVQVLETYQ
jgi:hypothetical protein